MGLLLKLYLQTDTCSNTSMAVQSVTFSTAICLFRTCLNLHFYSITSSFVFWRMKKLNISWKTTALWLAVWTKQQRGVWSAWVLQQWVKQWGVSLLCEKCVGLTFQLNFQLKYLKENSSIFQLKPYFPNIDGLTLHKIHLFLKIIPVHTWLLGPNSSTRLYNATILVLQLLGNLVKVALPLLPWNLHLV